MSFALNMTGPLENDNKIKTAGKPKSNTKVKSEDEIPSAIDKCIANGLIKTGSGLAVGTSLSLILLRRRMWPVILGVGIGLGMGISDCRNEVNSSQVVVRNSLKK